MTYSPSFLSRLPGENKVKQSLTNDETANTSKDWLAAMNSFLLALDTFKL